MRALAIEEQLSGPVALMLSQTSHSLVDVYKMQGKYEQAKLLLERVLNISEMLNGAQHFMTALFLNELAVLALEYERNEKQR